MIWNNKRDNWIVCAAILSGLVTGIAYAVFDHVDLGKDAIVENVRIEMEKEERRQNQKENTYYDDDHIDRRQEDTERDKKETTRRNDWYDSPRTKDGGVIAWEESVSKTWAV